MSDTIQFVLPLLMAAPHYEVTRPQRQVLVQSAWTVETAAAAAEPSTSTWPLGRDNQGDDASLIFAAAAAVVITSTTTTTTTIWLSVSLGRLLR